MNINSCRGFVEKASWERILCVVKLAKVRMDIFKFCFIFNEFYYQKHTGTKLVFDFLSVKRIKLY